MSDHLTTCEQAARAGGEVLNQWRGQVTAREKAPADLVTEADFAAQNTIQRLLSAAYPHYEFVGEESTSGVPRTPHDGKAGENCVWLVDPLDGTLNYVHGLPGWCVSVGLAREGTVIAGCVYDPLYEQCYLAERGEGAYLNGRRLKTSGETLLEKSLVAVSLPAKIEGNSPEIAALLDIIRDVQGFRRLGSAALNLCHVAAGNLDAYWAGSTHAWDVAAGSLLVEEAGGVISALDGSPFCLEKPTLASAATPQLHGSLVERLNQTTFLDGSRREPAN